MKKKEKEVSTRKKEIKKTTNKREGRRQKRGKVKVQNNSLFKSQFGNNKNISKVYLIAFQARLNKFYCDPTHQLHVSFRDTNHTKQTEVSQSDNCKETQKRFLNIRWTVSARYFSSEQNSESSRRICLSFGACRTIICNMYNQFHFLYKCKDFGTGMGQFVAF